MRPTYESQRDRTAERGVIDRLQAIGAVPGVAALKLPVSYRVDFALVSPTTTIAGWCEVKARSRAYPTMFVSLGKWLALRQLAQETSLPTLLAFHVPPGHVMLFDVSVTQLAGIMVGGRNDRGDAADQEPVAHLDVARYARHVHIPGVSDALTKIRI